MTTKNKSLIVVFAAGMTAYCIADFFFNDLFLYLVGGVLGSLLKIIGLQKGLSIAWLLILIGIIFLYLKINTKFLKWFLLVSIGLLLYWVDFILYEELPNIITNPTTYLHMWFSVLIKSSLFTLIYFSGNKIKEKVILN